MLPQHQGAVKILGAAIRRLGLGMSEQKQRVSKGHRSLSDVTDPKESRIQAYVLDPWGQRGHKNPSEDKA